MKKKEMTKAGALYFIATLFNKGIAFITVPIFSRILSTSDYGIVSTFNSWVSTIAVVMGVSLHMAVRQSFVDYEEKERPRFLSTIITFTGIIFAMVMLCCFVVSAFAPVSINMTLVYLCMIQSFGHALLNDYNHYLMMKYQYKARTALMVLPSFLSAVISVFAILYITKENLYMGRIVPTTLIHALLAVFILIMVYKDARPQIDFKILKYSLYISLPLVLHMVALHVLSQSDRIMISWLRDTSETGIYSLVYNFSMLAAVITNSLDGIWVPWFLRKLKARAVNEINVLVMDYVNLMTYTMVALILLGPEVLKIFADSRYWEGVSVIPPIVLANYMIFMYTLYVNVEHFHKKTPYITKNTVIAAIVNIVLNIIFIPMFGYVAAAFTTLASYFVSFVLHSRYAKKIEPDVYPLSMFKRSLIHIGIATAIYYFTIGNWYIRWPVTLVYIIIMFVRERYRIGNFVPPIARKFKFFREEK